MIARKVYLFSQDNFGPPNARTQSRVSYISVHFVKGASSWIRAHWVELALRSLESLLVYTWTAVRWDNCCNPPQP